MVSFLNFLVFGWLGTVNADFFFSQHMCVSGNDLKRALAMDLRRSCRNMDGCGYVYLSSILGIADQGNVQFCRH
jgi:hypothetical protein